MEQLVKYLNEKKYETQDITILVNKLTFENYELIAIENPNKIFYFKKTDENKEYFDVINASADVDHYFMNKNNYLALKINENLTSKIDSNLRRCADNFINLKKTIECMICYEERKECTMCDKCSYNICWNCLFELLEFNKISDLLLNCKYKCPNCRQYSTILTVNDNIINSGNKSN